MPIRRNIPEAIAVRERFIRSYDELLYRKLVKTKTEFCKEVGLHSVSNLIRMANEQREPSVTNILLLHQKFGVSMDWIMFGDGEFLK